MTFKFKQLITGFLFLALYFSGGVTFLFANPYEELTPDQPLYQRVKSLENYGLLDSADKSVLDQGEPVTRLQLAFYLQKAKAMMEEPELLHPTPSPIETPEETSSPVTTPPSAEPTMAPLQPNIAPLSVPTALPEPITPALRQEIDNLLLQFKQESAMLKARMAVDYQQLGDEEKEINSIKDLQNNVNSVWGAANASLGTPSFNTKTRYRFEDLNMSGLESVNAIRSQNELDLGMWDNLGGIGSISLGLGGIYSSSNASASGPASIFLYNPDINLKLDGPLGKWDTHFTVEAYPAALTFGDFSRSVWAPSLRNFVDPADIKRFSDDKDLLTWDNYMDSFTLQPAQSLAGAIVSSTDPVFDGVYGVGTNVPLLGPDGRLIVLLGRQGTASTQSDRFEEGLKLSEPFGPVYMNLSTEWVNDDFGINAPPQLDLKTYQADFVVNLDPVVISAEGGFSSLYTGINNGVPTNTALEAPAGQVEASFYPFNLFYTAISDGFANMNSKVAMAGVNFAQYGVQQGPVTQANQNLNQYGLVGEVDSLISDRYGWRFNMGWDGRKQTWMKNWPSFLDSILVNFNVAKKTEYAVETNAEGYNVVEAYNMIQPFYPDDEGLWGLDLWGGYVSPWQPAREQYNTNIEALRNDGDTNDDETRYNFTLSSEIIPLIMPVLGANGQPMTYTAATAPSPAMVGKNIYNKIMDLKSYNYIQLNVKWKINKAFGFDTPLYSSFYFTDNEVSGQATQAGQTSIPNLFEQRVYDIAGMYEVLPDVDLIADYGWETWNSAYTYPLVNYRTTAPGVGLAYDIPWGGGRFELRYKDVTFTDVDVPGNSYHTGQWYSELFFLF